MLNETEYLDLIVRYLNNPQDEKLQGEMLSFRSKSTAHENYFLEIERVWTNSARSAPLETIDAKQSAKRFRQTLTHVSAGKNKAWRWLSGIAALMALALVGLWNYSSNLEDVYIVRTTQAHQIDTVNLPDGSKVILAENASLKYADKFNQSQRNVHLIKGKAFFNIKKNQAHPFKVKIGESEVIVVGTSFNINLTTQRIDIDVKTGKVIFSPHKDAASSILTKGQALTYNIQRKEMTTRLAQNADSWLTKELVFVDTPLEEVCKQLTNYYGVEIKIQNDKHTAKKLNANFKNQSLDDVLLILNETYNIKINKEHNQIKLITPKQNN